MSKALDNARKLTRWAFGPTAAVAAATMKIDNLLESSSFPLAAEAGIWAQQTYTAWGFSQEFTATSVPSAGGSPLCVGFFYANNNNSPGDVVALIASANARTNGDTVFGANILVRNATGTTGTKLVGMEIDVQPTAGTTVGAGTAGLYINGFNLAMTANAIQIGGVGGGSFSDGLVVAGVTGAGLSPNGSTTMRALVDSGSATYGDAAVVLRNTHRLRLTGTASTHGFLYNDSSNNVRMVVGSGNRWTLRDSGDSVALVSLLDVGGQGVVNIETSGGEYRLNGTRVVGARDTGWVAMTGTANESTVYDTATVTTAQLAGRVMALQAALTTHGLIGT